MAGVSGAACWGREDLLSAYLDGELASGELAEVVEHLESCRACVATFRAVKEARAALRTLPALDPPGAVLSPFHPDDALSAYLDGELDTGEVEAVTRHLGECAACRDELQELDGSRTAIRALPRLELPIAVPGAVGDVSPGRRWRRSVALVAVAAIAATVGLSIMRVDSVAPLDLDDLATRHNARMSVESSFSVIPASVSSGSTP